MARIAFAWELGGELGHAMSCASLAVPLSLRGHHISFIFRELRAATFLRETDGFELFQAPMVTLEGREFPVPSTFADILLGCGYSDATVLGSLVATWCAIFKRSRPSLVVEDFAPTAILAARQLGIPVVRFGNGFSIPPRASPMPPFRFDTDTPPEHTARSEARALAAVNTVQSRAGLAPLPSLAAHFESSEDFLCTFPEVDHYGSRGPSGYWGPRVLIATGTRVDWPRGEGKRIVVYLKPGLVQLDALIDLLVASPVRVVAFIPDLDEARRRRLEGPGRVVATQPFRLEGLIKDCDLLVSHGGNIAAGTLCLGVPQLVFPMHYEQYITARRVEQLGAGGWLAREASPIAVRRAIERLLGDPGILAAARAYGRRYPAFSPAEQRRRMIVRMEELLAARILSPSATPSGPQR